jgi:hypothetical protein
MTATHITFYDTDTGNRDLGSDKSYPIGTPEDEITNEAINLASEYGSDVVVIIKTSPYGSKPGAWYIKGYKGKYTYETIEQTLEDNQRNGKFTRRKCKLIKLNY